MRGQPSVIDRLRSHANSGTFPHLLLAGPPGTGKTTAAMALCRDVLGDNANILEMNASDERKLESVRKKVKEFARTQPRNQQPFKVVFLDEADALTADAQGALRRIMEQHAETCRFIMSCNYSSKIIEPIQSRCAVFRFRPLPDNEVQIQITEIAKIEDVSIDQEATEAIVRVSHGDLRRAITTLQVAAAVDRHVTRAKVYDTTATAPPESLHAFIEACKVDGFHAARRRMRGILDEFGLAGTDFVMQLHRSIYAAEFLSESDKLDLTEVMAEIDYRLVEGGSEQVQLDALTAALVQRLTG